MNPAGITPGPWEHQQITLPAGTQWYVADSNEQGVALIYGAAWGTPQGFDNAALIATLPELIECFAQLEDAPVGTSRLEKWHATAAKLAISPGPWVLRGAVGKGYWVATEYQIAAVYGRDGSGEGLANARLIAAAPMLLDAVRLTLKTSRGLRRRTAISLFHSVFRVHEIEWRGQVPPRDVASPLGGGVV